MDGWVSGRMDGYKVTVIPVQTRIGAIQIELAPAVNWNDQKLRLEAAEWT